MLYLSRGSSDFDEIWHDDAVQPSWASWPLKIWNFKNPRWRRKSWTCGLGYGADTVFHRTYSLLCLFFIKRIWKIIWVKYIYHAKNAHYRILKKAGWSGHRRHSQQAIVPAAGNIAATAADAIPAVTLIIATTLFVRKPEHECAFCLSGRRKRS